MQQNSELFENEMGGRRLLINDFSRAGCLFHFQRAYMDLILNFDELSWWYNFVIFFSKWKFFVEESFGRKFLWYLIPGLGFLRKFRKKIKNQVWNILWQIFERYKLYSEIQDRVMYDNLSLISLLNNLSLIKLILKSWI